MDRWVDLFAKPAALAVLAVLVTAGYSAGQGMDFRIETDVILPLDNKPVQQSLTLFRGGVAYDYSRETPEQIMVLDHAQDRMVLLDASRKVQTIIDLPGLYALMESARNQAAGSGLSVFLEDARTVEFNDAGGAVRVGSKILRYDANLQTPPQPLMSEHYGRFADASAYLNAWRNNSPPPFARVALNAAVSSRQAIPSEITRTTQALDGGVSGEQVVRCRLHSNWKLSKDDYARIDEIDGMMAGFAIVSSSDFYKAAASREPAVAGSKGR
jgi:hypothetical protein